MNWTLYLPVFFLFILSILNRLSIDENSKAIRHLWNRMDEEMEADHADTDE